MRRTTRESNRRKAQRIADQYEHLARGGVRLREFREIMTDLYQELYGCSVPVTTVHAYAERWLSGKKAEIGLDTWYGYNQTVQAFLSFLGEAANQDIADLSKTQIIGFRDKLIAEIRASTLNRHLAILKTFLKSAKEDGFLSDNPAEFVHSAKETATSIVKRRAFTSEELQKLLTAADPEERSLILFGLYTGQRFGDLCRLKWANIDLERGIICLVAQKTRKQMRIPIAGPLRDHIAALPSSDDPQAAIHPWFYTRYSEGRGRPSYRLTELFAKAGLRARATYPKTRSGRVGPCKVHELSFHSLRHSTVSLLKEAGVPDAVVMELVGHSALAMSLHYTHVGMDALRSAADKLPNI
jgi:integrase